MASATTTTTTTTRRPAEPRVSLSSITPNNLGTLKKLNTVLFPVKYGDRFYADVLLPEAEEYCKLVYYNDIPVGTVCARIEKGEQEDQRRLYLMTMGILAPYRSRKLGTQALQHVLSATTSSKADPKISYVYLHVQVSNDDAKRFYERHGFKEVGIIEGYYKKITPKDAWILEWRPPTPPPEEKTEEKKEGEAAK